MSDKDDYYIKLGIAVRIPMAFERFCKEDYQLKKIPLSQSTETEEEAKINIRYEIYSKDNNKVASFTPSGKYLCFEDNFKSVFDQIVEELGYAAHKAKKAQDEHDEKLMKEMDEKFKLKD